MNSATSEKVPQPARIIESAELLREQAARFALKKNSRYGYRQNEELAIESRPNRKVPVNNATSKPNKIALTDNEFGKY
jgi:hypothetical protein